MNGVEFGFLAKPVSADFSEFSISPMDDHSARLGWISATSNADGFYYTPTVATYEQNPSTNAEDRIVGRSERPAQSYPLPSSHTLAVHNCLVQYPHVGNDESLIIYALALIFGTRLQRSEWRFDGRVPIVRQDSFSITDSTALDFVLHTYRWWKDQSEDRSGFTKLNSRISGNSGHHVGSKAVWQAGVKDEIGEEADSGAQTAPQVNGRVQSESRVSRAA